MTGLFLSGNELVQLFFALIVTYFGGRSNGPKLIAWGAAFYGLSCFILTSPHFIYGAGEDVLKFTKEYQENHVSLFDGK